MSPDANVTSLPEPRRDADQRGGRVRRKLPFLWRRRRAGRGVPARAPAGHRRRTCERGGARGGSPVRARDAGDRTIYAVLFGAVARRQATRRRGTDDEDRPWDVHHPRRVRRARRTIVALDLRSQPGSSPQRFAPYPRRPGLAPSDPDDTASLTRPRHRWAWEVRRRPRACRPIPRCPMDPPRPRTRPLCP